MTGVLATLILSFSKEISTSGGHDIQDNLNLFESPYAIAVFESYFADTKFRPLKWKEQISLTQLYAQNLKSVEPRCAEKRC